MPSSTPERQNRWETDDRAIRFLEARGFVLNRNWTWSCAVGYEPSWLEQDAIIYLIEEWDFGGLLTAECPSRPHMPGHPLAG